MKPRQDAIELAAQCWCDEETSHKEMDATLAMAFAKRLEVIMQERDTMKQQLEIAVKALSIVSFLKSKVHWVAPNNRDELRTLLDRGEQALEQIQKMRGG